MSHFFTDATSESLLMAMMLLLFGSQEIMMKELSIIC